MTEITVVVPTRDRPGPLRRCLQALAAQDAGILDVVVVDDGSKDRAAVDSALAALSSARLINASGRGPAAARNLGAQAADAELVCFIDDDCVPRPDWARRLAAAALDAPGLVAAGRTIPPPGASAAVRASQAITTALVAASLRSDGRLEFAPTCNLVAASSVLASLPFDPSYPDAAGEDRDWWARVVAAGVAAGYEPAAVVVHEQALGPPGLIGQQYRYGRGAARFRRGGAGERGYRDPSFYAGLVRAGFAEGPTAGGLVLAAQAATLAGIVSERAGGVAARHRNPPR